MKVKTWIGRERAFHRHNAAGGKDRVKVGTLPTIVNKYSRGCIAQKWGRVATTPVYGESQWEGGVKFHNGSDLGQEMNYWTFLRIVLSLSS